MSNQAGAFAFLATGDELEGVVAGEFADLTPEKLSELTAKSFVAPAGEVSLRTTLIASRLASQWSAALAPPGLFIVVPTLRCDHDCHYCQVSRAPVDREGVDLPLTAIPKILERIDALSSEHAKIEFQGGEPLLAFAFIKHFVEQASVRLAHKQVSYVVCSALGPLSAEMQDWLAENDVALSLSLDGQEIVHATNRPSKFFNSFQNTSSRLKELIQRIGGDRVSALATITQHSLAHPHALVQAYRDLGLTSIFLRPLTPIGFATYTSTRLGYRVDEFFAFYEKVLRRIIEINRDTDDTFVDELALIHLRRMFRPGDGGYVDLKSPSGYIFGALVFNYDGQIFGSDEARMLWEMTRSPELILGSIDSDIAGFASEPTRNLVADTFISCTPGCDECAYQPYCGADPMHHLVTQGDHVGDKSRSFFCAFQQGLYDLLFGLIEEDDAAKEVFYRWLSH